MFTPLHIEILLHCHVCRSPFPRMHAPAVVEAFKSLEAMDLIQKHEDIYCATQKGTAHIRQILRLPIPTQVFVDHRGEAIK